MRILLLGCSGQVGWELQRSLAPLAEIVALDRDDTHPYAGDLADAATLATTVRAVRPDVIVNAAAYTAVDKAESEPALAQAINADGPGVLATEAAALGAWLIHYSTDYVFDGSGTTPWREGDPTGPLNTYGRTKLDGEQQIRASGCRYVILRTSWVYASRGQNFARTMLRLASERDSLSVVADQHGAPTGADLLADVTAQLLPQVLRQSALAGTYHCVAAGATTWFDYARHVIERARAAGQAIRVAPDDVRPVPASSYRTAAARPANSRLDTGKLRQAFGLVLPDWRTGVDRLLTEITGTAP